MKTLPEILDLFASHVIDVDRNRKRHERHGTLEVAVDKTEDEAVNAIAKELMGCLPEEKILDKVYTSSETMWNTLGYNQALDEVRARLTAFIGKEVR